jgi:hypothetical protein
MGIRADIRDKVRREAVTKIHGQPTKQDLTILEKELITILANIPRTLGGGNHGHGGIIVEAARYLLTTSTALSTHQTQEITQQTLQKMQQQEFEYKLKRNTKKRSKNMRLFKE